MQEVRTLTREEKDLILSLAPEGATHVETYTPGSVQGRHDKEFYRYSPFDNGWEIYHPNTEEFGPCNGRTLEYILFFHCLEDWK